MVTLRKTIIKNIVMKSKKFPYPVSVKAYQMFVVRIRMVINDKSRCETMEKALHYYLVGRDDICFGMLDAECRLAFAFLRHDIDDAVCRSESARERALKRKAKKEETHKDDVSDTMSGDMAADSCGSANSHTDNAVTVSDSATAEAGPLRPSRRQRRAEARALRPKRKWVPIGRASLKIRSA